MAWLLLALVGCRAVGVETDTTFTVFVPAVAHDCSSVARHGDFVQAVQRCQARVWREHVEQARVLMPGDCATPEPVDYVVELAPTGTPAACYEE